MSVSEADKLELNPNVKVIESEADGLYYVMGAKLTNKQKNIGISGQRVEDMPDEVIFLTKRQLLALADDLPELIETYC